MTRLCKLGQTVLCLLFLTGCSSGRVVTQYRVVRVEVASFFVNRPCRFGKAARTALGKNNGKGCVMRWAMHADKQLLEHLCKGTGR